MYVQVYVRSFFYPTHSYISVCVTTFVVWLYLNF